MPAYISKLEIEAAIKNAETPDELVAVHAANTTMITHDSGLKSAYMQRMIEVKHRATTRANRAVTCDEQPTDNF